jgi:ribosomal protein S18 acetylase RimI-like enzyme
MSTTQPPAVHVRRAALADVERAAPLFDAYRQFYGQPADLARARAFLHDRLAGDQSTLLLAEDDAGRVLGFTQLYPLFSSIRTARVLLLNDLFVTADARRLGVARALLDAAAAHGRVVGAVRLDLETLPDNHPAQALYRAAGWQRYDGSLRFQLPLPPA